MYRPFEATAWARSPERWEAEGSVERGPEKKKKIQGLVISGRPREDGFKERASR